MPNIRIKDIPTTASATSSTDFIGIDGSANGTRKLNAYSPTFGGNLTVSGTATVNGSTIRAAADTNGAARGLEFYNTGNSALFGTIKADYTSGIIAYDAGAAVYGSNHVFTHGTTAGSVTLSAGSITATGNLTVSGGGATFGASGGGDAVLSLKRASDGLTVGNLTVNTASSLLNLGTAYTFLTFSTEGTEKARFSASTGNFLIGGTIDGGQKLQVSGTAAISSTLTVGSGTNTFGVGGTTNQSTFVLNGGSSNGYGSRLELQRNGSAQSYIGTAGNILGSGDGAQSDTVIYANGSNQVRLYSGNAITLTLDSSQRANFAGGIKISGNHSDFNSSSTFILGRVAGEPILMFSISSAAANERFYDFTATSTQFAMRLVNDAYSAATNFITVDRTGTTVDSVAIGGPLKLNNAYVAGAPTATGYVTIQDSNGTTYKVLVST